MLLLKANLHPSLTTLRCSKILKEIIILKIPEALEGIIPMRHIFSCSAHYAFYFSFQDGNDCAQNPLFSRTPPLSVITQDAITLVLCFAGQAAGPFRSRPRGYGDESKR